MTTKLDLAAGDACQYRCSFYNIKTNWKTAVIQEVHEGRFFKVKPIDSRYRPLWLPSDDVRPIP